MLYFSKFRIIFVSIISLIFIYFAASNFIKFDDVFFSKKINLGLDLQGGSYLLLEIDNNPVIEQKLQNTSTNIRNFLKENGVIFTDLKIVNKTHQNMDFVHYYLGTNLRKLGPKLGKANWMIRIVA